MDFYERVRFVMNHIPYGKAATYGQIALLCGKPRNSRQVGYALNRRLGGKDLPAHRVVNASGYLSGAASFRTPDTQKKLLEAEGVIVDDENRVDLKQCGWHHTLEDALEFREWFEQNGI